MHLSASSKPPNDQYNCEDKQQICTFKKVKL